ncbi:nuclear transport factor 2 family protein [Paenibacillus jiagnxiensis]|uniref:nuclear transport factor 2 family protein n=1 Tax=Paenibacillus jiagnxiensis TaxID=3228926 RepID=UPI003490BF1B
MTNAQKIFHEFAESILTHDVARFAELFDDQAVLEYPFAPAGYPQSLDGKETIREYMEKFPELIRISRFSEPEIHEDANSNVIVFEFTCEATVPATGKPYNQTYISVIHLKNGKIARYKDYWNPLVVLDSVGESNPLVK